jgi:hypothetical protein
MKSAWLLLAAASALATSPAVRAQTPARSAAEILKTDRPLQADEVAIVLAAARAAISGKAVRLSYVPDGPGPEMLIGKDGRPRYVRTASGYDYRSGRVAADGNGNRSQDESSGHVDVVNFTEYTGRVARKCDGTPLKEELVIEYERRSVDDRWNAKARAATSREVGMPVFDILAGATKVELGGTRSFGDRVGRALVAPWTLPAGAIGGPVPDGVRQSLWIDTLSFLPLRWSISAPAGGGLPAIPDYGMSFTYDASLDLRPPDGVQAPDCVQ